MKIKEFRPVEPTSTYEYHEMSAQQGWQCPICGAVNAPWAMQCPCRGSHFVTVSTNADTKGESE